MEGTGISSLMVEDVLNIYAYNSATATAEAAPFVTPMASETAAPSATPTPPPASATTVALATEAPLPTATERATDTPAPTGTPATEARGGLPIIGIGIVAAGLLVIAVVVFLVSRRR